MDATGWTVIIAAVGTTIASVLPQVANFIRQVRADKLATEQRAVLAEKVDVIKSHTDGITEKLVAVTSRASFQDGVNAQKAAQNAAEGQERRSGDSAIQPGTKP